MIRRIFALAMGLVALTIFAACGTPPSPPPPTYPAIKVYVQNFSSIALLPVRIAQDLGFYQSQHVTVQWVSSPSSASLWVEGPGLHYPIDGWVTQQPDAILLAPRPDPHFRLRSLAHLPIIYCRGLDTTLPIVSAVLRAHHAIPSSLEPMSESKISSLWADHQLPWAIVSLRMWRKLTREAPSTSVLAWFGASTGAIPVNVISGNSQETLAFMSAVNLGLWYLNTTPAAQIANLLKTSQKNPGLAPPVIKMAQKHNLWPLTVVLPQSAYQRAVLLMVPSALWPSYKTSVNTKIAEEALTRLPN